MISFKDLIDAGIYIEEKMENVVMFSQIENLELLTIEDLKNQNYTVEEEEFFYDEGKVKIHMEYKGKGISYSIEELGVMLNEAETVSEIIPWINENNGGKKMSKIIRVNDTDLKVILSRYINGPTALCLETLSGEPYEVVSINVGNHIPSDNFVLNHNVEKDGELLKQLFLNNIIEEEPVGYISYGFVVNQPIYKLSEEFICL